MVKSQTILIMAGGTGGHVIPGLSAASAFKAAGHRVVWLGTRRGLEATLVPKENIEIHYISIWGLRGKGWKTKLLAPFKLLWAFFQAFKILMRVKPDRVLGCGGFASGPGSLAAVVLRKPLFLHEQNAVVGLTNRLLAYFATGVFEAFDGAFAARRHAHCIGNPIRQNIVAIASPKSRYANRNGPLRLLVLGGSLGAKAINDTVCDYLAMTSSEIEVWHQTGQAQYQQVKCNYQQKNIIPYCVAPFVEDMAEAYAWADIVLARAGALTVSEIEAVGLPAIFVPYPYAVDDHQYKNAQRLVQKNAAIVVRQHELNALKLEALLQPFVTDRQRLFEMAEAGKKTFKINPSIALMQGCLES